MIAYHTTYAPATPNVQIRDCDTTFFYRLLSHNINFSPPL